MAYIRDLHYPAGDIARFFSQYEEDTKAKPGPLPDLEYSKKRVKFSLDRYEQVYDMIDIDLIIPMLEYFNIHMDTFIYDLGMYPTLEDVSDYEAMNVAFNYSVNPELATEDLTMYSYSNGLGLEIDERLLYYPFYPLYFLLSRGYAYPGITMTQMKYMKLRRDYPKYINLIDACLRRPSDEEYILCEAVVKAIEEQGEEQFGLNMLGTRGPYWLMMEDYLKFVQISDGKLKIRRYHTIQQPVGTSPQELFDFLLYLTDVEIEMVATPRLLPDIIKMRNRTAWIDTVRVMLTNRAVDDPKRKTL
jgi:hypothetical protein